MAEPHLLGHLGQLDQRLARLARAPSLSRTADRRGAVHQGVVARLAGVTQQRLGAHEQPVKGAGAIREYLNGFFSQVKFTKLPMSDDREVIISGDLAVERSSYDWEWTMVGSDEPITDQGSFLGVWRRQPDGTWKESHIMWHSWNPGA